MKAFSTISMSIILGGTLLVSTMASAQSAHYASDMSSRADHSSNVRRIEAQHDQHFADVAKLDGNYRAANADARAAAFRNRQAQNDVRFAHHEADVAKWDTRHGN